MLKVISSLLLTSALAAPLACADVQQPSTDDIRQLDNQIQGVKEDALDIAAELNVLEQRLLYPPSTRLTVSLALARSGRIKLSKAEIRVNGDLVAHYTYREGELTALQKGGVQNLYTGNVPAGKHELQFRLMGEHANGARIERTANHAFTKDAAPKALRVTLDLAARENEIRIENH